MSKALVIKGANFAANKIETITLSTVIPCTGLTISQDSTEFTSLGATETLIATVVPADTTEVVTWTSSDESVATVANGVVTCVGVGEATITATCGSMSATCSVSATVVLNLDSEYTHLNGYTADSTDLNAGKDYVVAKANEARGRIYYNSENDVNAQYNAFLNSDMTTYPIPIPAGTTHISIPKPTGVGYLRLCALDSQNPRSYLTSGISCKVLAHVYAVATNPSAELDIPSTADSFVIGFYTSSGYTGETVTDPVIATFT